VELDSEVDEGGRLTRAKNDSEVNSNAAPAGASRDSFEIDSICRGRHHSPLRHVARQLWKDSAHGAGCRAAKLGGRQKGLYYEYRPIMYSVKEWRWETMFSGMRQAALVYTSDPVLSVARGRYRR